MTRRNFVDELYQVVSSNARAEISARCVRAHAPRLYGTTPRRRIVSWVLEQGEHRRGRRAHKRVMRFVRRVGWGSDSISLID
jgi:hypothetical protein